MPGRKLAQRLPDPLALRLRTWVLSVEPWRLHECVCARLRARTLLLREALLRQLETHTWTRVTLPDDLPRADLLQLLERLTITTPMAPLGNVFFPLLPSEVWKEALPIPAVSSIPNARESAARAMCDAFQRGLLDAAWAPSSWGAARLDEYETLLKRLQDLRSPRTPFREALARLLQRGCRLTLEERPYQVPRDWKARVSATMPPAEIAHLILSREWKCDPQGVKERVARMRKERRVAAAWAAYREWLESHPGPFGDLQQLCGAAISGASSPPVFHPSTT